MTLLHDNRILLLDGAMGTEIMRHALSEADFRGSRFASHRVALKGNNDILCLTRPDIIAEIHNSYLRAGADIIETCSFNSQAISQHDYDISPELIPELNLEAALIARKVADHWSTITPHQPRYVAGSVGPTSKMITLGGISYDELHTAYKQQMQALIRGGVDILLIETCIDTLNAKCAIHAALDAMDAECRQVPIMVSLTIADSGGHLLSGSTIEGFVAAISHAPLMSIGINCSLGADGLLPHLRSLAACCPVAVSVHPNAGLPDKLGRYLDTPEIMCNHIRHYLDAKLVNIVGGCCGTTPEHIAALRSLINSYQTGRKAPQATDRLTLAGTEPMQIPAGTFINVGERCNVAGSRKFLRLISSGAYDEALDIARKQVEDGAMIIDINMDDAMLDSSACMQRFLRLIGEDPTTARVPIMVDSSRWDVIEQALKVIQGKAIVNSLSLKEGEAMFVERARKIKRYGAAIVVMAFDEQGQATTYERRIEICRRSYELLTLQAGINPSDIIFDPNILTVGTGIAEHADYALDFIKASQWIRQNLHGAGVSGGVSNLSFAFRGNNYLREAMHVVFLYHAISRGGMTMAILNPATAVAYDEIPDELRTAIEDLLFNKRTAEATERLTELASVYTSNNSSSSNTATETSANEQNHASASERIVQALIKGSTATLEADLNEAIAEGFSPMEIISGPLMAGMDRVGELLGQGKMFLPQVVKTARTMKVAVGILISHMASAATDAQAAKRGKILFATVKGDVHDIGKNIVSIILECNGYEIIDLGVMVPPERIIDEAQRHNADIVCLSGLITPSLEEMRIVAEMMQQAGLTTPLMIGGATTSAIHTALRIAPEYPAGVVIHMPDASQNPIAAAKLLNSTLRAPYIAEVKASQQRLRDANSSPNSSAEPKAAKTEFNAECTSANNTPTPLQSQQGTYSIDQLRNDINWLYFYHAWSVKANSEQGRELRADAEALLDRLSLDKEKYFTRYNTAIFSASGKGATTDDAIHIGEITLPTPRQKASPDRTERLALCDFVGSDDKIGVFATTISQAMQQEIEQLKEDPLSRYELLLLQTIADRLAEATAEAAHRSSGLPGIRPAVGYPSLPDQRAIFILDRLMPLAEIGIVLTENGAMYPPSSTAGIYIANADARYFSVD